MRSNSLEVNSIAIAFIQLYEREQAVYVSKFYTRMKIGTLKRLLGKKIKFDRNKF
jgi:hypothetical protein